ncbi:hypothetical protein D3C87_1429320 [compost metagenome]
MQPTGPAEAAFAQLRHRHAFRFEGEFKVPFQRLARHHQQKFAELPMPVSMGQEVGQIVKAGLAELDAELAEIILQLEAENGILAQKVVLAAQRQPRFLTDGHVARHEFLDSAGNGEEIRQRGAHHVG